MLDVIVADVELLDGAQRAVLGGLQVALLDEVQEEGVEVKLYSPLDPKHNALARELSYIYLVKQVEVETPLLFINSDHRRFLLARIATQGSENPFESAIFSDDQTLLQLVSLLLIDGKNKALLNLLPA